MKTRFVLTMAAVMALLAPSVARAVNVYGVLTNDSSAVQVDSVYWYISTSPMPIPEPTPGWGGQVPMTDTFQFMPLEEWPLAVVLYYSDSGVQGKDSLDPLVKNQQYRLSVPGSQVMFTDSFTGIAERPETPAPAAPTVLRISPNPLAGGFATVSYSLPQAGLATLRVYDVTGRTVLLEVVAAGRAGTARLDLRKLEAAVYLVKVETGGGFSTTQKLVVQR